MRALIYTESIPFCRLSSQNRAGTFYGQAKGVSQSFMSSTLATVPRMNRQSTCSSRALNRLSTCSSRALNRQSTCSSRALASATPQAPPTTTMPIMGRSNVQQSRPNGVTLSAPMMRRPPNSNFDSDSDTPSENNIILPSSENVGVLPSSTCSNKASKSPPPHGD